MSTRLIASQELKGAWRTRSLRQVAEAAPYMPPELYEDTSAP